MTVKLILLLILVPINVLFAGKSLSTENSKTYFINLVNGQTVTSPFKVVFGLTGMGVAPAGVDNNVYKNIGHHHLLINSPLTEEASQKPIPFDRNHLHFGKGQTETELNLPVGEYTLQLVFADPLHLPHEPIVASEIISIHVNKGVNYEN